MPNKTVLLFSGGLDSTVLLYKLLSEGDTVTCLSVDYGQRHVRELGSAEEIAEQADVPLKSLFLAPALAPLFRGATSSQVGQYADVPTGHYADESMKTTIVPGRNLMLLSLAGTLAVSLQANRVAYAAHSGDHAIYPDCRPEFALSVANALELGYNVRLYTPFIQLSKADIVREGALLNVPFELTYSCYKGEDHAHCGVCGTCYERREAFRDAGVPDPTLYATPEAAA